MINKREIAVEEKMFKEHLLFIFWIQMQVNKTKQTFFSINSMHEESLSSNKGAFDPKNSPHNESLYTSNQLSNKTNL